LDVINSPTLEEVMHFGYKMWKQEDPRYLATFGRLPFLLMKGNVTFGCWNWFGSKTADGEVNSFQTV